METNFGTSEAEKGLVLIVPCGMETLGYTSDEDYRKGINCTLRNGNIVTKGR